MGDCIRTGPGLVGCNDRRPLAADVNVDSHHLKAGVGGLPKGADITVEGRRDDAVDAAFAHVAQIFHLPHRIIPGIAEDNAVASPLRRFLDPLHKGGPVVAADLTDQHANGIRPPQPQRSSHAVGAIVELAGGGQNADPGFFAERAVAGQNAAGDPDRDAGFRGHLLESDGFASRH